MATKRITRTLPKPIDFTPTVIERAVGEIFSFNGGKFTVVEDIKCNNCELYDMDCWRKEYKEVIGVCVSPYRTDKKNVVFKKIDNE